MLCGVLLLAGSALAAADKLNVHVSTQRFRGQAGNTVLHLDYQIPYQSLVFLAKQGGYFAEVDVLVEVMDGDSLLFSQSIRDNVGISNRDDAKSGKSHLNRASFYLEDRPYEFRLQATDLNSGRIFKSSFIAKRLEPGTLLSDVELCVAVRPDSSSYLSKFHRGNTLYQTQPKLIFDKGETDQLGLYLEIYTQPEQRGESGLLILTIQKDSLIVSDEYLDFTPQSDSEGITLRIPLAELKPGRYDGDLEFQLGDRIKTREFVFFVTEPREDQYFIFPDPDQEFQLLRYFLGSNLPTNWRSYSEEAKRRYITLAWKNYAQSNDTSPQAMLDTVRGRVEYANRYYGHFDPGWTSDRGRIHIRNGKPDEIESSTTSDETRYVRKDYQIWKYRGRINAVYLFLDMQMNGNYKLIYVNNDDNENSHPDYMRYLGDDFDTSELSN